MEMHWDGDMEKRYPMTGEFYRYNNVWMDRLSQRGYIHSHAPIHTLTQKALDELGEQDVESSRA